MSKPMTLPAAGRKTYQPKTWTVTELDEHLRSGKPVSDDDCVIGEGAIEEEGGKIERAGWCMTVGVYLEVFGEDADVVELKLEPPHGDGGAA